MPASDLDQLKACLGEFLLQWCFLENDLTGALLKLRTRYVEDARPVAPPEPFEQRLSQWRRLAGGNVARLPAHIGTLEDAARRIDELRVLRNQIVHHLAGAGAGADEAPHLVLGGIDGPLRVTQDELSAATEKIEWCRSRIRWLSDAALAAAPD